MKECVLSVRSLGCDAIVLFRVSSKFKLDPELLEDRLRAMMGAERDHRMDYFEIERIVGEQGAVFYQFRVPHGKLFDSQKQGLLGALAQVEREVEAAVQEQELLRMVEKS